MRSIVALDLIVKIPRVIELIVNYIISNLNKLAC